MINEDRTVIIKGVELWYARLDKPVAPFNNEQRWEVQIRTSDESVAKEWEKEYELNVAKKEDYWKVSLKRKLLNRNNEENDPPQIVDATRTPISGANIGNGSKANIKLYQYPYNVAGKKGTGSMLKGVQITELIKYEPDSSIDFEVLENTPKTGTDF